MLLGFDPSRFRWRALRSVWQLLLCNTAAVRTKSGAAPLLNQLTDQLRTDRPVHEPLFYHEHPKKDEQRRDFGRSHRRIPSFLACRTFCVRRAERGVLPELGFIWLRDVHLHERPLDEPALHHGGGRGIHGGSSHGLSWISHRCFRHVSQVKLSKLPTASLMKCSAFG